MIWYCGKKGLGYKLMYVTFSPTFRCNLRCIMCSIWRAGECGNNPDFYNELSTDRILSLMDELKKLVTGHLHFTGGEPLLRKDLFEILRHGKELGMTFSINTNGTKISRLIAENFFPNVQLLHNLRQKSKSGVYGKISKDSRYKNDVQRFEEIRLKMLSKQPFF
jgi:MoaA/NifB/PqqE/SkfB family radical SAM enzyme